MKTLLLSLTLLATTAGLARASGYDDGLADGRASCALPVQRLNPNDLADENKFPDNPNAFIPPKAPNDTVAGYEDGYRVGATECGQAAAKLASHIDASWSCLQASEEMDASILGSGVGAKSVDAGKAALMSCISANRDLPSTCFGQWVYCFHRKLE